MYKKELDSGTLLFVEVPMDAFNFKASTNLFYDDMQIYSALKSYPKCIKLPEGNWQLLGFSTEITERQLKDVINDITFRDYNVKPHENTFFNMYLNFLTNIKSRSHCFGTAIESFKSLKSSLGLIDENKYQFDWDELCRYGHGGFARDGKTEF